MSKIKEMFKDWRYVKICLYIVFTAALLYIAYLIIFNFDDVIKSISAVLGSLTTAFSPLIIGLIFAYILSPLVDIIDQKVVSKFFFKMPADPLKAEKRLGHRRTISILITFLLISLAICAIIYAFAVLIVGDLIFVSIRSMVDSIIAYFMKYESVLSQLVQNLPHSGIEEKLQDVLNGSLSWLAAKVDTASIMAFIAKVSGSILNIVLGIVVSIYLLKDKEFFLRLARKTLHLLLPMRANAIVSETLSDINAVVSQFVRGQLLDALLVAVMSSIGFTIIGLDFAVLIGCFAGLCNVIPYFGPFISVIPAALIGFLTGGLTEGFLAIMVVLIIQQIDGNITYPRIVGSSTGLHPLFILISVSVGGYYGGILGMIVAVPITAILRVLIMKRIETID